MKRIIVADSSSNVRSLPGMFFASAPLKIRVGDEEFVDDEFLEKQALFDALKAAKGPSSTSCPNVADWTLAFGDADEVFALALTSAISGGYDAALNAADLYRQHHPDARVFVLDSRTTGPELELLIEKYAQLIGENRSFDEIVEAIQDYTRYTRLMFSFKTVDNFARNGRVNPLLARLTSALNIRLLGQGSESGAVQVTHKTRGEKHALKQLLENMLDAGFAGGRVCLRHTMNPAAAEKLACAIKERFPDCPLSIGENQGLCSYYAEPGGLLVGFESTKEFFKVNGAS